MLFGRGLWTDIATATRRIARTPWITLGGVFCVALSLGPTLVVSMLADALVFRPVPGVTAPDRVVSLTPRPTSLPGMGGEEFTVPISQPRLAQYRARSRSFDGLAGYQPVAIDVVAGERSHRLQGQIVTDDFFEILRPRFVAGQPLGTEEGVGRLTTSGRAVVVSESLGPAVLGKRLRPGDALSIEDVPFTVVGLVDERFRGPEAGGEADLWFPAQAGPVLLTSFDEDTLRDPNQGWLFWMIGRLAPGASAETAQSELDELVEQLSEGEAGEPGPGLLVHGRIGLRPGTANQVTRPLTLLFAICLLLAAVASANLGGLLLSRTISRSGEIVLRLALGCDRWSVVRPLLVESVLLAMAGGISGSMLALGTARLLEGRRLARFIPPVSDLSYSPRVFVIGLAAILLSASAFAVAPAIWTLRREARGAVAAARTSPGASRPVRRWLDVFVLVQLACTVALLLVTGSILQALRSLHDVDPGFEPDGVLNVRLDLTGDRHGAAASEALVGRILRSVETLPEVRSAAIASSTPIDRGGTGVSITGVSASDIESPVSGPTYVRFASVSGDYFRTLGISMLSGTGFTSDDVSSASKEVVVNEALARALWGGRDPVGRTLTLGEASHQVVGVVESVRQRGLDSEPEPYFYVRGPGADLGRLTLHLRTSIEPSDLTAAVRGRIASVDPYLPVFEIEPMTRQVDDSLSQPRLLSALFGVFSGLALLVALIGLGSALAFAVRTRNHEFGVRLVLGARRSDLLRRVLVKAMGMGLFALLSGFAMAMAGSKTVQSFLYGVAPADPLRVGIIAAFFLTTVVLASVLPAWRGSLVDPVRAISKQS